MSSPRTDGRTGPDEGRRRQAALYGASISASVGRVVATLGLSQAAIARTLGVSPPMLSQLVSGQRVKLGNPLAVQRLQSLLDLVDEVDAGLPLGAVAARLEAVAQEQSTTLTDRRREPSSPPTPAGAEVAEVLLRVLSALASRSELVAAARILEPTSPALARALRAAGSGSTEAVAAALAEVRDLL